jgi:hypothetical protein
MNMTIWASSPPPARRPRSVRPIICVTGGRHLLEGVELVWKRRLPLLSVIRTPTLMEIECREPHFRAPSTSFQIYNGVHQPRLTNRPMSNGTRCERQRPNAGRQALPEAGARPWGARPRQNAPRRARRGQPYWPTAQSRGPRPARDGDSPPRRAAQRQRAQRPRPAGLPLWLQAPSVGGGPAWNRAPRAAIPASSWVTVPRSPVGRRAIAS